MTPPPKAQIHVLMPDDERQWLKSQADRYRTSVTEVINALIDAAHQDPELIPTALRTRRNL